MRRREFIAGLGATITGSIQTNAQELPSLAFVGYLDDGPAQGFIFRQVVFREGLAEVDYFEGCNVAIEAHRAELQEWANDLVSRGVAVLVASASLPTILAAKAATTTIPIVFGCGADPIETGLVSSLESERQHYGCHLYDPGYWVKAARAAEGPCSAGHPSCRARRPE